MLSPPRSGSTLLRVMLGGHPGLFAPPELELLSFDTLAERGEAFTGRDSFWLEGAVRAVMEVRGCGPEEARGDHRELRSGRPDHRRFYGRLQEWLGGPRCWSTRRRPTRSIRRCCRRAEEGFEEPLYIHLCATRWA